MKSPRPLVLAALTMVLTACSAPTPLERAVHECGLEERRHLDLLDDATTLEIQTRGRESASDVEFHDVECVLDELGAPNRINREMRQTRALDGRRSDEWEGFSITWSYHPERGVNTLITQG